MSDEENTFAAGTILAGRYQVRRELGRGGMGVVYLCRDLVVDERVALKLLVKRGSKVRPEDAWWFHEEARALAGLSHPSIVRARDFGSLPDGTPYLVMDYVAGRSLHEWLYLGKIEGQLPWPIVWSTIDHVLGALAHSHARGVIHGDLKPSNIIVDLHGEGEEPSVYVLDLGLAWLMQDRVDHRLDGRSSFEPTVRWGAGTPGWMAPEQIRFAAPHVGPATDLYALGCILFALLSDDEPYSGSNDELLKAHRSAPIPDPLLPAGAPPEVTGFVKRLMAKRPWHRYDFAGDARRAWRRFKPSSSATTTPVPGGLPRSAKPSLQEELPNLATLDLREDESTTAAGLLGLRPSPFVARTAERTRLLELCAEVESSGRHNPDALPLSTRIPSPSLEPLHRLILLCGEAGVGKSRVAEWLCEEVHERALMIPLRARYRKIAAPLDGVIGAVTQHYRLERADRNVIEKVLMNLWGVSPDDDNGTTWVAATAEWLRPASPGDPAGPSGKRFALDRPELRWHIIVKTLERIGKEKPILLWMDDLHHAGPATFEGLSRVHREAKGLRILVVATARSEAVEADPAANAALENALKEWNGERMDVQPLSPAQTHALLRETLPLDDAAVAEAALRSKGNPLFALQLLHAWAMGGHLELREGRYGVPKPALAARAATTAELWEERLTALPEDFRKAALAAAALGGDIRRDVLRYELEAIGIDAERAIAAMQRAQILLSSGTERLRWPHALLQEHLLTQLFLQPNAARVFRAAADALGIHPAGSSLRVVRHRVTNLVRAGDFAEGAMLLHSHIAVQWTRSRDPAGVLRDLALLDGKLHGTPLAAHLRWRAEALRYAGRFEEARHEAEQARHTYRDIGDREGEAHCLRLLGHIASELAAPAQGRRLVARSLAMFEELQHGHGCAQAEVMLGEIDYLVGDHRRARTVLGSAADRFLAVGDRLGHGQCIILQSYIEQAGGSPLIARELLRTARADFDAIGYRLGLAQADLAMAHCDHREGKLDTARAMALIARASFRDLAYPRGEAGAERLLAMASLDAGEPDVAEAHARASATIFDRMADPWGQVETRLLLAQVALDRGQPDAARGHLIACEAIALVEAEPKQHRHLTLAWLAYHDGRFVDAAKELDSARAAFKDPGRTGDHTPMLLERFAKMGWPRPANIRIAAWKRLLSGGISSVPVSEL